MGLFSDIYNTVAKFFRSQDEHNDASKSVATNRLKLVLMQDRTNLTPKILEQMRSELIDLLSRYLEMDKELLELNFEQEGEQVALMLSIPVIRAKDEEEIEVAMKERSKENITVAQEDKEEDKEEDAKEVVDSDNITIDSSVDISSATNVSETISSHVSTPEDMNSAKIDSSTDEKEEENLIQ